MSKSFTVFLIAILAFGLLAPVTSASSKSLLTPLDASEPFCGNTTTVNLLRNSDKKLDSGDVTVANGETTLFVTYTTASPWTLVKTDLAVASSLAGIPVTSKGNPKVDQFPYRSSHAGITTYTYEIPLSGLGNTIYIAAHADLRKVGSTKTEGAWADGTPFTPGKRSWGMYFIYSVQTCNQPPVAVNDTATVAEDSGTTTINVLANDTDAENDPFTIVSVTQPANGTVAITNAGADLTYQPNANYCNDGFPADTFTYTLDPGGSTATVAVTVTCVDDLPVAVNDAVSVAEDSGPTVVDVLVNDSDADGDPFTIAAASDPAHGTVVVAGDGLSLTYQPDASYCNDGSPTDDFTYSLTPGGSTATVAVTVMCVDDTPVAVNDTATVNEDSGANAIDVLANDADPDGNFSIDSVTQPANGTVVNNGTDVTYEPDAGYCNNSTPTDDFTYTLTPGGSTATVAVTVTCMDDAPTAVNDSATVLEDSAATTINVLANDTDSDGGPISVASVTQPANGTVVITNGGADLTYQPNANACNDGTPTDDFTYTLSPGGSTATVAVTVTCVNDAPSFNIPASPNQTVVQDSGAQTVSGFATNISAGPANESGQTLTFNVSNNNNALFSSQPDIDESTGDLTYTPANGATGSATVSVYLTDNGGTTNGGVDTSATQTFTITVTPPNAAPVANDQSVSTNEDTLKTITLSATDADGNSLTFSIVDNPAHGSLGSFGSVDCLSNPGTCTVNVDYTPSLNYNGPDSFTFKANDTVQDSNTATLSITVDPVNDAPSFTSGGNVTVNEDSGAYSAAWATGISAGPSNESGQTLTFNVQNNNPSLFSIAPAIASDGTLSFTPAADAFGTATITVVLSDNGGTANGGVDTSAPVTFDITVTGVNDAPSFTSGGNVTVDEDSGAQTVNGWATAISAGPNESGQTVSFLVSNNNNALFSAQPAVSPAGVLTYTPAANQNGSATVSVQITDNGGTANGGVDTSAAQTFTITVNAVNDAPVALTKTGSAHTNMKIEGVNPGLLTGVTDADSGINGCTPTFTVASITAGSGGTVSSVNLGVGTFDFDPTPGFTGTAVVNYTVQDNGCPGTATSAPAAINITVSGPVIWFVNASVAGPGTGTLADPFKTVASADAVDAANHRIFLYQGSYATGIALNSGEWLIGQGATNPAPNNNFDALFGITPPSGTIARPVIGAGTATIQNTVTLASSVILKGLTISSTTNTGITGSGGITGVDVSQSSISTTTGTALSLNNVGGTLTFTAVAANGAATGVDLTNVGATVSIGSGTIQNTTTAGVSISGGTGNFTQNFSTLSNTAGRSILVQNRTGGTVTFGGTINGGGTGILLSSNTGSTINFTAGIAMNMSTGANAAFTATGGGTLNITGNNALTTTTGTALRVENTTIGASGLTFRSISANGGANGIVLNNTGSSGGLTVTGDGVNTSVGGNSSGGTISNMVGADGTTAGIGVYLNNTHNVTLRRMTINGTNQNYGIKGLLVNGFVLEYSTVSGTNGTAPSLPAPENYGEGAIYFGNSTTNGVVGTATFTNNNISGGRGRNLSIVNTAAGTTTLTVKGNTFGAIQNFTTGGTSFAVEARVSSGVIINSTVGGTNPGEPNTFTSAVGDLVNFTGQQNTTMSVVMRNNTLSNNNPSNIIGGGSLNLSTAGTMTFDVTGNTMRDANGSAVTLFKAGALSGTPSMSGVFSSNTIGVSGVAGSGSMTGNGIFVSAGGTGTMSYTITNNTILQYLGNAAIYADNTGGSYTANFTITGNNAAQPGAGAFAGLAITNGSPSSSDTINVCADIKTNDFSAGDPANANDIIVGASGAAAGHTFNLPGYAGGANLANVQSFIQNNNLNPGTTAVTAYTDAPVTAAAFTGVGTTCSTP